MGPVTTDSDMNLWYSRL